MSHEEKQPVGWTLIEVHWEDITQFPALIFHKQNRNEGNLTS